ncbi:MAG: GntR family transcriptional regulator [Butyricicoccus pullicaecorum]|nr:GntR family transcriptional regulator [Butyricicoccus pullicaecorum]
MEEDRYQDVCTYVRRLIEQGQLRPGDRLPTERALSQDLGVSRGTVRDGLRLLESMGVLESRQGSGNYLSNHMGQYLAQSLHFMLLLGEIDYQSINRMRRAIELQSYRIAIQTSTPEQVQGLWRIQEELERTRSAEKDEAFHDAIIDLGGDPLMRIVSDALSDVIGHLITQFLTRGAQDLLHQTLDTHRRMIEYLEQRRVDAGCVAITRHYDIIDTEIARWQAERRTI